MRKEMKIIIVIVIIAIIGVSAAGYMYYHEMQKKNEELNKSLNEMKDQLEEVKLENNTKDDTQQTQSTSKSSSKSSNKVSSSSGKVTYEEAGVDKNVGYMKTCKYAGCGAVYNSRLSHCQRCGQRNIYV